METFTSTHNNFGAPSIQFRKYGEEGFVVLNTQFSFSPANEDYRNASVLEIKADDFGLDRSIEVGVFIRYKDRRIASYDSSRILNYDRGTVLKSWIKDRNTLCIEKLTDFDDKEEHTIYILAMYVGRNGSAPGVLTRTKITFNQQSYISFDTGNQCCVVQDNWVFLCIGFSVYVAGSKEELSFTMSGFPEDISATVPILGLGGSEAADGAGEAMIENAAVTYPLANRSSSYGSSDKCFVFAFFVRG